MSEENSSFKEKIQTLGKQIENLQHELLNERYKVDMLVHILKRESRENEELRTENKELRTENEELRTENEELKNGNLENNDIQLLKNENERLKVELEKKISTSNNYVKVLVAKNKKDTENLENTIVELEKRIHELEALCLKTHDLQATEGEKKTDSCMANPYFIARPGMCA